MRAITQGMVEVHGDEIPCALCFVHLPASGRGISSRVKLLLNVPFDDLWL